MSTVEKGPRSKRTRKGVGTADGLEINTLAKGVRSMHTLARDTLSTVTGIGDPESNVVNLADWRQAKVPAPVPFDAFTTAQLRALAETNPQAKRALIDRRIQEVAEVWGIDLNAPRPRRPRR